MSPHVRTYAGVSAAARLGHGDAAEEHLQLRVQQRHVPPAEYFGHKGAARRQQVRRDVESSEQQLGLKRKEVEVGDLSDRRCKTKCTRRLIRIGSDAKVSGSYP